LLGCVKIRPEVQIFGVFPNVSKFADIRKITSKYSHFGIIRGFFVQYLQKIP